MAQFKTDYFKFDGASSEKYNIRVVNVNNDGYETIFGLDRSVNSEKGVSDTTPVFYGTEENCPSITVELFHCDKKGNAIPISDIKAREITRWLFKKEPVELECNGYIYYGVFTNGKKWAEGNKEGYFTLTFEMVSSLAYSPVMIDAYKVTGEKIIEINNRSTYDDYLYPDIECSMASGNSLKITNLTTGQVMKLEGATNNEHFIIYNDGIKQIASLIDGKRNLFGLFNKEWLRLYYGINRLKIECENAEVKIMYQYKIQLY